MAMVQARAGRNDEAEKLFDEAVRKLETIKSRSIVNALLAQAAYFRAEGNNSTRADELKALAEEKRAKFAARRRSPGVKRSEKK
jgi:hypothetical protein